MSQSDYLGWAPSRREDNDAPGDQYRHYDIAGAGHARGARVVVSARSAPALARFTDAHPGAVALPLDVTQTDAVLAAAQAGVGDDRLQQQARGVVVPESFTHGSSRQRMRWFSRGMQSGDPAQCDTFRTTQL